MKKLVLKFALLFIVGMSVSCSKEDPTTETSFKPIEITFSENFFTDCDQIKTINKAKISYRKQSKNEACSDSDIIGDCGVFDNMITMESRKEHPYNGQYRIFLGNHLEVDLSEVKGASKILLTVDDNCSSGCTSANLYKDGKVVSKTSNKLVAKVEDLTFDIDDSSEKVTVFSCEANIYKITIK